MKNKLIESNDVPAVSRNQDDAGIDQSAKVPGSESCAGGIFAQRRLLLPPFVLLSIAINLEHTKSWILVGRNIQWLSTDCQVFVVTDIIWLLADQSSDIFWQLRFHSGYHLQMKNIWVPSNPQHCTTPSESFDLRRIGLVPSPAPLACSLTGSIVLPT